MDPFEPGWQPVVVELAKLMGLDGFDVARAAALKLLRHVHLASRSGRRGVWIVSLPVE